MLIHSRPILAEPGHQVIPAAIWIDVKREAAQAASKSAYALRLLRRLGGKQKGDFDSSLDEAQCHVRFRGRGPEPLQHHPDGAPVSVEISSRELERRKLKVEPMVIGVPLDEVLQDLRTT